MIATRTADAIQKLEQRRNVTELRSFKQLWNVYRDFAPSLARIAAPLNRKLQEDQLKKFGPFNKEEHTVKRTINKKYFSSHSSVSIQ